MKGKEKGEQRSRINELEEEERNAQMGEERSETTIKKREDKMKKVKWVSGQRNEDEEEGVERERGEGGKMKEKEEA